MEEGLLRKPHINFTKIHLEEVIIAIENCIGISIPYPIAKKMAEISEELKVYLKESLEIKNGN